MTLRNIPLGMKIGLGSVGPLVLVVLLGSVTTLSIRSLSETRAWVEHTHEVIEGTLGIEKLILDLETGERGFLIAGKEEFHI